MIVKGLILILLGLFLFFWGFIKKSNFDSPFDISGHYQFKTYKVIFALGLLMIFVGLRLIGVL